MLPTLLPYNTSLFNTYLFHADDLHLDQDNTCMQDDSAHSPVHEGFQPQTTAGTTASPSTTDMVEALTKGMEEVICNILGNGGGLPTPRRTLRQKKLEDNAV